MSCGITRIVGVADLTGENATKRMKIEIPNPEMNRIWTQLVFKGFGYGAYSSGTDESAGLTQIYTWGDFQGITVTLPFKPNAKHDPEFPDAFYREELAAMNPQAIIYGFY